MDDVIDNIMSMQSSYDDIQPYVDAVQMPNTVRETDPHKTGLQESFIFIVLHNMYFASS